MKITDYEIFPIGMPYAEPYIQATGVTKMARRVILKLHTDEGIIGLGEASTLLPNRTGETAEVIAVVLKNHLCPLKGQKSQKSLIAFLCEAAFFAISVPTRGLYLNSRCLNSSLASPTTSARNDTAQAL